jgi:hypothetical protein
VGFQFDTTNTSLTNFYLAVNWTADEVPAGKTAGVDYVFNGTDAVLASDLQTGGTFGTHPGVYDLTFSPGTDLGADEMVGDIPAAFYTLGLAGSWKAVLTSGLPVFGILPQKLNLLFDGKKFLTRPEINLNGSSSSSSDGQSTPSGADLPIIQGRQFAWLFVIENYSGPDISGGSFAFKLISTTLRNAGTAGGASIGLISSAIDGENLNLTLTIDDTATASLETTPPHESLHYVYECVLTTAGNAKASVLIGAATIVRNTE